MLKQLIFAIVLVSFLGVFTMAQDKTTTDKTEKKECAKGCCSHESKTSMTMATMDMDSIHTGHKHGQMKSIETEEVSIVWEGEIDLAAIDENKDSKVYQDQMCWNVISDEPGECPQCGMILKEVSLNDAQKNLEENGFEVN